MTAELNSPDDACCYHCGDAVDANTRFRSELGGQLRPFCCAGCQTVAQTIHAGGLAHFYARRGPLAKPEGEGAQALIATHALFDTPELQQRYVRIDADGMAAVTLMIEHIRCAACVWLNEQHVGRQRGVSEIRINYATRRAELRWDPQQIKLSQILDAIAAIGYRAWPFEATAATAAAARERKSLLLRLAVALFAMMQVMMYAWPVYWFEDNVALPHQVLMRWASLLLTVPVVVYSAQPILAGAWNSLKHRHVGMDVPVALGIVAAFVASVIATLTMRGEVYFDSLTMFVAFLLIARFMELRARQQASSGAEELARQVPATCERFVAWPQPDTVTEAVLRLAPGDVIRIKAGDVVPVDGVIVDGASHVEESLLTGESLPLARTVGDRVLAGSHNAESPLAVEVRQVGQQTRLAEIARVLDQALLQKPRLAELADRVAAWFIVALLGLAAGTGVAWYWFDPTRMLPIVVAVLVVSCPCALSLATPAALAAASGALARRGLLVIRGHTLETLAQVTDVMLDKTGTLTEGRFALLALHPVGVTAEQLLMLAVAAETGSEHPVARTLAAAVADRGLPTPAATQLRNQPGAGVEAVVDGLVIRVGNRAFAAALAPGEPPNDVVAAAAHAEAAGSTVVWCAQQGAWLGCLALGDVLRDEARALVDRLARAGIRLHLVSGDTASTVAYWAAQLGIDRAAGAVTPEGKRDYVARLQQQGAVVLAVGDGVNDAPVLAQAQVSIAVGSGVPLAAAGADAVLAHVRIGEIGDVLAFAGKVRSVIRQNLLWALVYNLIAIPAAALGLVSPWIAGIGMSLSSLLVVGNAWRLRRVPS